MSQVEDEQCQVIKIFELGASAHGRVSRSGCRESGPAASEAYGRLRQDEIEPLIDCATERSANVAALMVRRALFAHGFLAPLAGGPLRHDRTCR